MKTLNPKQTGHIIVDYQNDFVKPGASMYVSGAEKVEGKLSETICKLTKAGILNIYTQDRHPAGHVGFAGTEDLPVYSEKDGETMRPYHCMAHSKGADIYGQVGELATDAIKIHKGKNREDLGYSGFENTGLDELLKSKDIKNLFVSGVATDYCVKATVLDALQNGYEVFVLGDCIKEFRKEAVKEVFETIEGRGGYIIDTDKIDYGDKNIYIQANREIDKLRAEHGIRG